MTCRASNLLDAQLYCPLLPSSGNDMSKMQFTELITIFPKVATKRRIKTVRPKDVDTMMGRTRSLNGQTPFHALDGATIPWPVRFVPSISSTRGLQPWWPNVAQTISIAIVGPSYGPNFRLKRSFRVASGWKSLRRVGPDDSRIRKFSTPIRRPLQS
jgi:hypothetical protein